MVITEMVSSADNIARGFLPGGGLAAGLVAISSKSLKPKDSSLQLMMGDKRSHPSLHIIDNPAIEPTDFRPPT